IPSSSLADMAFLLLIFFMVSTTFRKEQPRPVEIPDAEATKKLDVPRKDVLHIWVERNGDVWINDVLVPMQSVNQVVGPLQSGNPSMRVVLRADSDVPYRYVDGVQQELREAGALYLTFYTSVEQRLARERR